MTCRIPLRALTVVTGVSGSGKSSLAFDTLYAEGQRRYVSSLSTYARQFLERLPRPAVDSISHLPPAIAIEQRNTVTSARSTVGTATEILDHLRVLFAKIGVTRCPDCDLPVRLSTVSGVAQELLEAHPGRRVSFGAPLVLQKGERAGALRDRLLRSGHTRLLDSEGSVADLADLTNAALEKLRRSGLLLIDRVVVPSPGERESGRARIAEAVAAAFSAGRGDLVVVFADRPANAPDARATLREGFRCHGCGRAFPKLVPALFSFHSPLGACGSCKGFGRIPAVDFRRVVPDASKSLRDGAIAPFTTRMGRRVQRDLLAACEELEIPVDCPFEALGEEQRDRVLRGDAETGWYGVQGFFDWLNRRRYKVQAATLISRYRRYEECEACGGTRLGPAAGCVTVAGRDLGEVTRDTVGELHAWLQQLTLTDDEEARAGRLVEMLAARVQTVVTVGLDYVALDRQVRTLSGGEVQRIQLATALGGRLTSSLYVLDEPSIGLHAADVERLVSVLNAIRDHGNTVVVVEHAPEIVSAADHVIDLGPAAGRAGGQLVVEGTVAEVRAHPRSVTGRALRGEIAGRPRAAPRAARGSLRVVGARENNLRDLTVEIPLGQLVVVTGVSGAGKSTLIEGVLVRHLQTRIEGSAAPRDTPGACDRVEGAERIDAVVVVDQSPASRSPRSNPATVSKAFDGIRARFAATREARALGVGPGWFSFNVAGGRCETCEGAGEVVIDMQFLDDVRVPCDACGGLRYRREVRDVRLDGRSITDVLALTIEEACQVFQADRKIVGRLEPFTRVGLGYLSLGQPLSTLSGGEHQRVRLAQALGTGAGRDGDRRRSLFVLDEPTTGLHPADIEVLLTCLEGLIDTGGSAIVVEHNLDVIRRADFVLDLGPEGGPGGGRVVAAGTPEEIAATPGSRTGEALRKHA